MKTIKNIVRSKLAIATVATVLVVGGAGFALEKTGVTHFTSLSNKTLPTTSNGVSKAQTTSKAPTAQSNYSGGSSSRQAGNTLNENQGSAVVSDNNGVISNTPSQSTWTVSSTGQITVYAPAKNAVLTSGSVISGSSTLPEVSFILLDNISGQISTGKISVVNGKFSGTVTYNTTATMGQLNIFGTKADATEFSNIAIPLRFN